MLKQQTNENDALQDKVTSFLRALAPGESKANEKKNENNSEQEQENNLGQDHGNHDCKSKVKPKLSFRTVTDIVMCLMASNERFSHRPAQNKAEKEVCYSDQVFMF